MTKNELIERLSVSMESRMVNILTDIANDRFLVKDADGHFTIDDLIDLTFFSKKEVAFRFAWILEYSFVNYPCIGPHLDHFLSGFARQDNPSCMRHYGKIAAFFTGKKVIGLSEKQLEETDMEPLLDTLFAWLIDEEVLVATKVHCMQALANLAPRYPWIKDELLQTIYHLEDKESIAFFGRAKQVKKQLGKMKI